MDKKNKAASLCIGCSVIAGTLLVHAAKHRTAKHQAINSMETVISSPAMDVLIDRTFPRAIQYKMKTGAERGKLFYGQPQKIDTLLINNVPVIPKIKAFFTSTKAVYVMTAKDLDNNIDAVITGEFIVSDNILTFRITNIKDNKMVQTIEIPNHNLISVRTTQKGAVLDGANMSVNTHHNGDRKVKVDNTLHVAHEAKKGYMYAFLSTDDLSSGLFTNAESNLADQINYSLPASKFGAQRIIASASKHSGFCDIGLSSNFWTYQKDTGHREENNKLDYGDETVAEIDEMPCAKVIITGDANNDKKIDWQDGAIAYRKIMNNPLGYEKVPDLVGYRISMNFGSQAQNPFLMVLDGVKKVCLNTDSLGQAILLKGYGSEGHDSGHLNYADIGARIGGVKDMLTLLEKGKDFGASFGIHVNASETYPESKYFDEGRLLRNEDGTYKYGWNWLDQGININADYDLRHGRAKRFKDLYDRLGGKENQLEFVYVDVWGNRQSGDNGTWESRQLAKEINSLGWRLAGEWGFAFEYDSTFQHWAADLTYGDYTKKGINSTIARFIRNHQKDSWVGEYTNYGGAADAPLLFTYSMKDFEGWQGRSDYSAYINNLFAVNLPAKFIQHYKVMQWTDGKPVIMSDNKETYQWKPGMKAVLKDSSGKNTVAITRASNDYTGNINAYRTKNMTYNGKKIYTGRQGNETYLIPWFWDANGKKLAPDQEKLYHWNTKGGTTSFEVPDGWRGSVVVSELTELGKANSKNIQIRRGKITLEANAATPYLITKIKTADKPVHWSEGMHLVDVGFNSASLKNWIMIGDADSVGITKSEGSNHMLTIRDNIEDVRLTQRVTDLKENTKYAAYVGLDNRSEFAAGMEIAANGKTYRNESGKSIAKNYIRSYPHNTLGTQKAKEDGQMTSTVDGTSYFQNMYVFFETGSNPSDVTLSLTRKAGKGGSYFDDIRIVENGSVNQVSDTKFVQDFEHVAQGIYPFVIGNAEGIEDNRTHLAECRAPYTQRGWNQKTVNDVISGKWSLKANGLTEADALIYQTIPQNFKFEPSKTYRITFDYESGGDGTYALVTGNAAFEEKGVLTTVPMPSTANPDKDAKNGTYTFDLIGDASGQSWFGIYSTKKAADIKGASEGQSNFNGYKDFILDNLVIEMVK